MKLSAVFVLFSLTTFAGYKERYRCSEDFQNDPETQMIVSVGETAKEGWLVFFRMEQPDGTFVESDLVQTECTYGPELFPTFPKTKKKVQHLTNEEDGFSAQLRRHQTKGPVFVARPMDLDISFTDTFTGKEITLKDLRLRCTRVRKNRKISDEKNCIIAP